MQLKNQIAVARWKRAENKVNSAVGILSKYGLAYSRTDGIIGNTRDFVKKDMKKISAAANTMGRFGAGFFRDKQQFNNNTAINPVRYTPLKFADYTTAQEKAFKQANESMHLLASLKFLQRVNFDPRLQAHPNRRVLGLSPEDAQEWAAGVESLWRDEKELKDWDESNQNNYSQLADMAFASYLEIGEFFVIRRAYFDDENRITNTSQQIISPFQIQSPNFTSLFNNQIQWAECGSIVAVTAASYLNDIPNGHYIESGIEYDAQNREISIFICPTKFGDPWIRVPIKNKNGFTQVLHGFIQSEPGQKRGISDSAKAWHEFCNIKDLTLFELDSARLNSSVAGSVTADSNAQPNGRTPMGDLGKEIGWSIDGPVSELADYEDPGYSIRKVESGGFIVQNFTPGYTYKELDTKRPNINIPKYIDTLLNYIYPSISGISRNVVSQVFEGSYNASKGAIDLSWKNGVEYYLKQFTSDYHRPNYSAWLGGKVATGEVAAPGWEDRRKKVAWSSVSIITPAKPSLNPKQEAEAGKIRSDQGFSNRELESQQMTGTSAEENAERLEMENEKLAIARKPLEQAAIDLENAKNQGGNDGE